MYAVRSLLERFPRKFQSQKTFLHPSLDVLRLCCKLISVQGIVITLHIPSNQKGLSTLERMSRMGVREWYTFPFLEVAGP